MSDSDQTRAPAKVIARALSKDGCSEQRCMADDNIQQNASLGRRMSSLAPSHRWIEVAG